MGLSRQKRMFLLKLLSMFSVVRGYNILVITLAQYLASIFIMGKDLPAKEVLLDLQLFMLVTATALTIASGYIINNFYDKEKDLINRPYKSMLDRLVSQQFKLTTYFILNFIAVLCASYVSFRAVLFFAVYIFGIWLYSHKLKRLPFLGNLTSAILTIVPFFAVFVYYKNFETAIFVHATFLFLLISMRELIKDLENMKGDMALGYQTIPILYGETMAKGFVTVLIVLTVIPAYLLIRFFDIGQMHYYFYFAMLMLVLLLGLIWRSNSKLHYLIAHNILKFIIVAGVISILLIDASLIFERFF